ncbi:class I SAM-dependent methyltransferase [Pontibacter vulgaris]|uniref:class I SAM-dependent methyltransferase n=1 Tax=Pontibacter vulgaris TaxID=2905679 RepID=UPI001FA7020E|nr:class I SAM-dependent methyltransferase [Pontibacter vulgaris]
MNDEAEITLLNLKTFPTSYPNFKSIAGNACDLSYFENKCFDVVFSNSVIEHLFTKQAQQQMASEVQRVGKNYYIQTPNLYFPVEPHWIFPLFQFLPFDLKVALTLNFDLGHYKKAANKEAAIQRVKEVRLLSEKEMKSLFADGEIYRERIGGLTKSITLYKFSKT